MAEAFYRVGDRLIGHVTSLADDGDFDFDPSDWRASLVNVETYIVGASADVKMLIDSGGDFSSPETTITLDSFSGNGISEGNETPLVVDRASGRITNTSGGSADFVVVAEDVSDLGEH